jgi:hypothetical protein
MGFDSIVTLLGRETHKHGWKEYSCEDVQLCTRQRPSAGAWWRCLKMRFAVE